MSPLGSLGACIVLRLHNQRTKLFSLKSSKKHFGDNMWFCSLCRVHCMNSIVNEKLVIFKFQIAHGPWLAFLWFFPLSNHENFRSSVLGKKSALYQLMNWQWISKVHAFTLRGWDPQLIKGKGREWFNFQFPPAHWTRTHTLEKQELFTSVIDWTCT